MYDDQNTPEITKQNLSRSYRIKQTATIPHERIHLIILFDYAQTSIIDNEIHKLEKPLLLIMEIEKRRVLPWITGDRKP